MDLNVPDFLGPPRARQDKAPATPSAPLPSTFRPFSPAAYAQFSPQQNQSPSLPAHTFAPEVAPEVAPEAPFGAEGARFGHEGAVPEPRWGHFGARARDPFALPAELQGGVGTILSRRPLYAAESFTRTDEPRAPLLASVAAANRMSRALDDQLLRLSLGGLAGFQARRPSQLAGDFLERDGNSNYNINNFNENNYHENNYHDSNYSNNNYNNNYTNYNYNGYNNYSTYRDGNYTGYSSNFSNFSNQSSLSNYTSYSDQNKGRSEDKGKEEDPEGGNPTEKPKNDTDVAFSPVYNDTGDIVLDNGLLLRNQYILASPELKAVYARAHRYFQDSALCAQVQRRLARLLARPAVARLVAYIKNANNLAYSHKTLCLVVNKNGKLDLLTYPSHSNLQLQRDDLVIVDGDRGKDMVMIVDPAMRLDLAVLFNFVKKTEHLKSLTIVDAVSSTGRLHAALVPASRILNSGEDNEFTILLPTKQVLRFATPKEVHRLSVRFNEERRAFVTCHAKIKELGLDRMLSLVNVEYQFDFKKLIFYYFGNFYRVDFRGLIKELFKIYKTRIWLCAVLPCDHPELYTGDDGLQRRTVLRLLGDVPPEYSSAELFAGGNFDRLTGASYFHTRNILNLIDYVERAADGYFYGFNGTL